MTPSQIAKALRAHEVFLSLYGNNKHVAGLGRQIVSSVMEMVDYTPSLDINKPPVPESVKLVSDYIRTGDKTFIDAVKFTRNQFNVSLKDAKDFVEKWFPRLPYDMQRHERPWDFSKFPA